MHRNGLVHGNIHEHSIRVEHEADKPRLCDIAFHCGEPTALPLEAMLYHSADLRSSMVPDAASDIYAAGMLGYRMLIGSEGPFLALTGMPRELTEGALADAVKRGPGRPVPGDEFSSFSDSASEKLATILSRMVGAPGQQVFASLDEVEAALNASDLGGPQQDTKVVVAEAKTWTGPTISVAAVLGLISMAFGGAAWMQKNEIDRLSALSNGLRNNVQQLTTTNAEQEELIAALNGQIALGETNLAACIGDVTALGNGVPERMLAPALARIQDNINAALSSDLAALAAACQERDSALALLPLANALASARQTLEGTVASASASPFVANYGAIDVGAASALLAQIEELPDTVTASDIETLTAQVSASDAALRDAVTAYQTQIAKDISSARDTFANQNESVRDFLLADVEDPGDLSWENLSERREILAASLQNVASAMDERFGVEAPTVSEYPRSIPGISEQIVGLQGVFEELNGSILERAQALQDRASSLDGVLNEAYVSAVQKLNSALENDALLQRAALLQGSVTEFEAVLAAANSSIQTLLDGLMATMQGLEQRGMPQAGGNLTALYDDAKGTLDAFSSALASGDLDTANASSGIARDMVALASSALQDAENTFDQFQKERAITQAAAEKAELARFAAQFANIDGASVENALSGQSTDETPLSERLAILSEENSTLMQALGLSLSHVKAAEAKARAILSQLGNIETEGSLDTLFAAETALADGRFYVALTGFAEAEEQFREILERRKAPRDITVGFSPFAMSQLKGAATGCVNCDAFLVGAEARTATVKPFKLDVQEATYGDVLEAFAIVSRTPDASSGMHVGIKEGDQMTWSRIGTRSLTENADRFGERTSAAGLSARDAEAFCEAQGKRLPTEAEWEYAAAGSGQRFFPVPEDETPKNPWDDEDWRDIALSIGQRASPEGYVGLSGGVREWVTADDGYALKGGSFRSVDGAELSIPARLMVEPGIVGDDFGVRCAVDLEQWP
ncbi:MAG: SUMF1/EgtB/PvdO family nonheme iron enzyme [Pseudomonadota bacterium]